MSATDIILIIGAVGVVVVNIINALKLDRIANSVDGAASKQIEKITALETRVASMVADKAETKERAALLAQAAVKDKPRSPHA